MYLYLFLAIFFLPIATFADDKSPILSWDGYGLVKFGEKLETIEKKIGEKAKKMEGASDYECGYVSFSRYPYIDFMVEKDTVTRADDFGVNTKNLLGLSNESLLKDIEKKYNGKICRIDFLYNFIPESAKQGCSLIITPWEDDNSHYLMFLNQDGTKAILAEESGGKIENIRAGLRRSAQLVEGCQ